MKDEQYFRQLDRDFEANLERQDRARERILESRMEHDDDNSLTRALRVSRAMACKDRTCGADDCPTCRPGTWRDSVIKEMEEDQPETGTEK